MSGLTTTCNTLHQGQGNIILVFVVFLLEGVQLRSAPLCTVRAMGDSGVAHIHGTLLGIVEPKHGGNLGKEGLQSHEPFPANCCRDTGGLADLQLPQLRKESDSLSMQEEIDAKKNRYSADHLLARKVLQQSRLMLWVDACCMRE